MPRRKKIRVEGAFVEVRANSAEFESQREELSRIMTRLTENLVFLKGRVEESKRFNSDYHVLHSRLMLAYKAIQDFYSKGF